MKYRSLIRQNHGQWKYYSSFYYNSNVGFELLEPTFIVKLVVNDMMYVKKILIIPCEFVIGYSVKHGEYCCKEYHWKG